MPDSTSKHTQPHTVLPANSTPVTSTVPVAESLSKEDKLVLYAALQDIANEIRRIDRERKKHN